MAFFYVNICRLFVRLLKFTNISENKFLRTIVNLQYTGYYTASKFCPQPATVAEKKNLQSRKGEGRSVLWLEMLKMKLEAFHG